MQGAIANMRVQDVRAQLRISQKKLATIAHVSPNTISACENGEAIQIITQYALLDALNEVRKERNMPPLSKEDIEWKIRGEL